jgi:diguanylate cyclase (GGDEF)-like protein
MRILIAEDDPVSCKVLEGFLNKWGYDVSVTKDGEEAWQVLQHEDAPQMAILDWMMPQTDGLEVCRRLRRRGPEPYVYVLLLTAKGQKHDVVEGIEAGADDYLTKPFDPGELHARLRAGRRILALQGALISARDALRFQATHDPLTGLWNRLASVEALSRELSRSQRQKESISVIMADLDHFKSVNDNYGHLSGDVVLRGTASRIASSVRAYDTVGRYGGEEFILVLPESDLAQALHQAKRIRDVFEKKPFDLPEGRVPVTLSLGVASLAVNEAVEPDGLVWAADQALYRAKHRGRNRVEAANEAEIMKCLSPSAGAAPTRQRRRNGGRAAA